MKLNLITRLLFLVILVAAPSLMAQEAVLPQPSTWHPQSLADCYIRKPKLSREGANVTWVERGVTMEESGGDYGEEGFVFQAVANIPEFAGNRPVFGVWMVNHEAAGLGIREDTRRITGNLSRFVPHFFPAMELP